MKTLIAYSSKTGNTKKVAQAISQVVQGDLIDIRDNPNIDDYDTIIVGYWARRGRADDLADEFMQRIHGKNVGVFATVGAYPESPAGQKVIRYGVDCLEKNGNCVKAFFHCHGKIDPALAERAKKRPADDPHAWTEKKEKRHKDASSHPDEFDLKKAQEIFQIFSKEA